jgi:hypothetical protein
MALPPDPAELRRRKRLRIALNLVGLLSLAQALPDQAASAIAKGRSDQQRLAVPRGVRRVDRGAKESRPHLV